LTLDVAEWSASLSGLCLFRRALLDAGGLQDLFQGSGENKYFSYQKSKGEYLVIQRVAYLPATKPYLHCRGIQ